jgi:1-deoxy-D-xylulose-5-phosphate synthase
MSLIKSSYKFLDKVNSIAELKSLCRNELSQLAADIRLFLINSLSKTGGHVASNLGVIEATIALHYLFDSPKDKIIWDVSHQCYTHKILTGRRDGIEKLNQEGGVSGFTNINESEHDIFNMGHTSVSISLAFGLAKARDIAGQDAHIIAFIGDGALSGGQAYEALNSAITKTNRLIIVVNDNQMSIDPNNGALYKNLKELRETNGESGYNLFKTFGYEYLYVQEGNDVLKLLAAFEAAKTLGKPVVVHICTKKGKGFKPAEETPNIWHYHSPFDIETGESTIQHKFGVPRGGDKDNVIYASPRDATSDWFRQFVTKSPRNVIVAAATQFVDSRAFYKLGPQYLDVDIGEQNAVSFASALSKGGSNVFLMIQSSFLQRAYDQIAQDWCMQNTAVSMVVVASGISSLDYSHAATFDIALLSNIPNLVYLSPTCLDEYIKMLDWCSDQKFPTAIRLASGPIEIVDREIDEIKFGKSEVLQKGSKVAILGLGKFLSLANEVSLLLKEEHAINATIINPRFITHLDEDLLMELAKTHSVIVTLEDGIIDGGFGQKVQHFFAEYNVRVLSFGAKREFTDHVPFDDLMKRYELTSMQIVNRIRVNQNSLNI